MRRRTVLRAAAGSALLGVGAAALGSGKMKQSSSKMPVVFLAHGSPLLLDDKPWVAELAAWAKALPAPSAVLVLSAHWVDEPVTLGAARTVPLVYDFYGFPARYYDVTYPAPGAPAVAARVRQLLGSAEPVRESDRGLDHGAYVPLVAMYPHAQVPVLQVSMPTLAPDRLYALGRALAPLRDEGVLIMGSGFLTHNMRSLDWNPGAPTPRWATEFDHWAGDALARKDVDALLDYRARAPGVNMALPTHEHFVPALVALGSSSQSDAVTFPITGFTYGSFTKRSLQFG
jgi:4,5-DOPA dioxygenase extradiol